MRCMYNGQVSTRLHQTQSCNHLRAAPKTMALDSTTTLFGHCWALLGIAGYCWAFRPNTIRCKVHGPIWCVEGLFENSHSLNHSKQVLSNFVLAIGPRRPEWKQPLELLGGRPQLGTSSWSRGLSSWGSMRLGQRWPSQSVHPFNQEKKAQ